MFSKARFIFMSFSLMLTLLAAQLFVMVPTSEAQSNSRRILTDVVVSPDQPIQTINLFHTENWSNTATLGRDQCGGASQGATFPVTLTFDVSNKLTQVAWFSTVFAMTPDNGSYYGVTNVGDATYRLYLTFDQPSNYTSYSAHLNVTFPKPGGYQCMWAFTWQGTKQ